MTATSIDFEALADLITQQSQVHLPVPECECFGREADIPHLARALDMQPVEN